MFDRGLIFREIGMLKEDDFRGVCLCSQEIETFLLGIEAFAIGSINFGAIACL